MKLMFVLLETCVAPALIFAMNHYTSYVNLARAFDKIERHSDDLNYAEEIWSNLQRAAEVTTNATNAFTKIYRECTRAEPRINTAKLDKVLESIKQYTFACRNAHHWYAEHLMWRGRFDEALQESERARQLDPLSLIIAADHLV